jgi:acyl carrier protein
MLSSQLAKLAGRRLSRASAVHTAALLPKAVVASRVMDTVMSLKYVSNDLNKENDYSFVGDLSFDSGIHSMLMEKLSDEFCLPIAPETAANLTSTSKVVDYFASHPKAR